MKAIKQFFSNTVAEMRRCVWPSKQELFESTYLVLVVIAIVTVFVLLVDAVGGFAISALTGGSVS